MKTLRIIIILIIGVLFLSSCEEQVKVEPAYQLVIKAYQLGYLEGTNAELRRRIADETISNEDKTKEIEKATLVYIKVLGLDSIYYKYSAVEEK